MSDPHVGEASGTAIRGQIWRDGAPVDGFTLSGIARDLEVPGTLIWADLNCPSHEMLATLAEELNLSSFTIEDTVAAGERVKSVSYGHYTFMTVYAVRRRPPHGLLDVAMAVPGVATPYPKQTTSFDLHRISLIVQKNMLITVRLSPGFDMDHVVRRWEEVGEQQYGVGALVHGLLDVVVDEHFDAVQYLDSDIEDIEELLFTTGNRSAAASRDLQRRTYDLRKELVQLRRVVLPMREVVGAIQRRRSEYDAPSALDPHYSDLYDHVLRVAEWTESLRDMVTTIFETNLSLADSRLNTVMKKLTGWAGIIAVPTAITGFFGQNVPFFGFGEVSGFIASVVLIAFSMGALYIAFKRRDWL